MTNVQQDRDPNLRPWVYSTGTPENFIVYRAFSIGDCIRSLTASRLGEHPTPPPDYMRASFDESGGREGEAIDAYEKEFGVKVDRQAEAGLTIADGVLIRGHMDGLTADEVVEVKWLSQRNFDAYLERGLVGLGTLGRKYAWQGAVYSFAAERPIRFLIGNKGFKEDEPYTGNNLRLLFSELYDPADLPSLEEIAAKIKQIEEYAAMDELPECDAKCGKSSFFAHVHFFDSESGYMADETLGELIVEAYDLKVLLEGDPDDKEDIGLIGKFEELKTKIKTYDTGTHVSGPFSAQVVERKGSQRLDSKRLRKEKPELYEEFSYLTAPTRSVVLKKQPSGIDSIVL